MVTHQKQSLRHEGCGVTGVEHGFFEPLQSNVTPIGRMIEVRDENQIDQRRIKMDVENPIIVDFPLRGEWVAPNTPGDKVPSHGTDALGQRFAFDFLRTDPKDSKKFFDDSQIKYYLIGIPVEKSLCYKEKIYSPIDGKVIAVMDGIREPKRLHPFFDIMKVLGRSLSVFFNRSSYLFTRLIFTSTSVTM
jgi:hypothetical protein